MTTLPNTTDQRGQKAIALIASGALEHLLTVGDSNSLRLVPSMSKEGSFYVTDAESCTCADARYRRAICKHQQALRIAAILEQAAQENGQSTLKVVA